MSTSFRQLRRFLGPRWLTVEGESGLVGYSLDLVKDAFMERLRLGHLYSYPQNGSNGETPPADALAAIGRDRRVIRGLYETDAEYAARELLWIDDRKRCGNPFALMQKLAEYLGTRPGAARPSFRTVDNSGNWYSRAADGTETSSLNAANWNWDNDAGTNWSRFWVVIYTNGSVSVTGYWTIDTATWGSGTWGEADRVWGSSATPEEVQTVRAIIADWKPAGTQAVCTLIAFDASMYDPATPEPNGTWGNWSKVVANVQVAAGRDLANTNYWSGC